MKFLTTIFFICCLFAFSHQAEAGLAEARDVALSNNCPPKKIEVFSQTMGASGKTVYRVQCVLPKAVDKSEGSTKQPDALLINCMQSLCVAEQPVTLDKK